MLAYQIQFHQNPAALSRFMKWIYNEKDYFYISVDRKSDVALSEIAWATACENVYMVERHPITWGGASMVSSLISAMQSALKQQGWSYFINLSALDVPLVRRETLLEVLQNHGKQGFRNFVSDFGSTPFLPWRGNPARSATTLKIPAPGGGAFVMHGGIGDLLASDARTHAAFLPVTHPRLRNSFYVSEAIDGGMLSFRPHFEFEESFLSDFYRRHPYRYGRQWIIASRELCDYVVSSDVSRSIYTVLKNTFIPDESFVQSVVASAPKSEVGGTMTNNLRYYYGAPESISDDNLEAVQASKALFARKLAPSNAQRVIAWVDSNLGTHQPVPAAPAKNLYLDIESIRKVLVASLAKLGQPGPGALLDWPDYHNIGDHLIWLGAVKVLKELGFEITAVGSITDGSRDRMSKLPKETTLFFLGGGNFGDLYETHQVYRNSILKNNGAKRAVVLPQSVAFKSVEKFLKQRDAFSDHSRCTFFARDYASLEKARDLIDREHLFLVPDCAFALQDIVSNLRDALTRRGFVPNQRLLLHLRHDIELNPRRGKVPAGFTSVDWEGPVPRAESIAEELHEELAREVGVSAIFTDEYSLISWKKCIAGVIMLSAAEVIITDRLHGHILACLLGKQHILLDNALGKNSALWSTWTKNLPNVTMAETLQAAIDSAKGA